MPKPTGTTIAPGPMVSVIGISQQLPPSSENAAMTYGEIIAGFRALQASDFDLMNVNAQGRERLYELTDAVMTLPSPEETIPEMFAVMERLPESDLGSPGPLVHTLETFTGYEQELVKSVRRKAQELSLHAIDSAVHADAKETAAMWQANAALREAEFANSGLARHDAVARWR